MTNLTSNDMSQLVAFRRALHAQPEISGEEEQTAEHVAGFLADTRPDRVLRGLGGYGVAVVYEGEANGPTVMFRAELDALPIEEESQAAYRSRVPGKGHLCGHDGHMATLAALGRLLGRQRPARGRAVLLFQPAEETGAGAAAILADPAFREIAPDHVFSLHNWPGLPFGHVSLKSGTVNCASRGMRIVLRGRTAHSSMPETGTPPTAALGRLMPALERLSAGTTREAEFTLVTVTHARMGIPAFGIAPGDAELWVTLRTLTDARMAWLCHEAESLVREAAAKGGLALDFDYHEIFRHCENDPVAVGHLVAALEAEGVPHDGRGLPVRASEDFGRFGDDASAAMFFLGAGEDRPQLHNPDYDFPDDLIGLGARIFLRTARNLLG